jgi:hypothetical protein
MSRNINKALHAVMMALGVAALGAVLAPNASAGCADMPWKTGPANSQRTSSTTPVSYRVASVSRPSGDNPEPAGANIVGMWKFAFVSKNSPGTPDDILIDWGFTQWHSDGTEIINSAMRSPSTQNFCLGVWKKTGPSIYKLNHQALNFDAGGTLIGLAVISEEVTVDTKGDSYAGTFTINLFDTLGNNFARVAGEVTAIRITVD